MPEVKDPVRNEEIAPEVGGTPVSAEDGIVPAATAPAGKEKPKRPPMQMDIWPSLNITLGAFALSVALGILFGIYPAAKASKLQPVEALRAE